MSFEDCIGFDFRAKESESFNFKHDGLSVRLRTVMREHVDVQFTDDYRNRRVFFPDKAKRFELLFHADFLRALLGEAPDSDGTKT